MLPFKDLPKTDLWVTLRLIVPTRRVRSFVCISAELFGVIEVTDLCGKMFLRHSRALFFLIVSLVTPEQAVKA